MPRSTARGDPIVERLRRASEDAVRFSYEQAFMFFLPRICEHCLNPSCVASCPSGAMYKRAEDGIVLVDQDQCRGWRMCVTGCPYKKVYFNHRTGKAEKCTFCYPRIEVGLPTVCSETCVGRLRYLGLFLYDVDRVTAAASVADEHDLYEAQLDLLLDPHDPAVIDQARRDGIAEDWIVAAQRSPVYQLAKDYRVALPLHPEFRTMPMVWYIPPLSPVVDRLTETGHDGEDAANLFGAIDALRIPIGVPRGVVHRGRSGTGAGRVAEAGGDAVLHARRDAGPAARRVDRDRCGNDRSARSSRCTGCSRSPSTRSVTSSRPPTRARPTSSRSWPAASTSTAGPAWSAAARSARVPDHRCPCRWRPSTHCGIGRPATDFADPGERGARINLLNWDGKGRPPGLFPPPHEATAGPGDITGHSAATPSSADPGSPGTQR